MRKTIELENETLITLRDVPVHLPKRKGKKVHYSTVWRWVKKGARGRVLESVLIGGVRYTSVAALDRFFETGTIASRHSEEQQDLRDVLYGKQAS